MRWMKDITEKNIKDGSRSLSGNSLTSGLLEISLNNIFIQTNTIRIHAAEVIHIQDKGEAPSIVHDESGKSDVREGNCTNYE